MAGAEGARGVRQVLQLVVAALVSSAVTTTVLVSTGAAPLPASPAPVVAADLATGVREVWALQVVGPGQAPVVAEAAGERLARDLEFFTEQSGGRLVFLPPRMFPLIQVNSVECSAQRAAFDEAADALAAPPRVLLVGLIAADDCPWAGLGRHPGQGQATSRALLSGVSEGRWWSPWLLAHEVGHTLGLGHANARRCSMSESSLRARGCAAIREYGDGFDPMGQPLPSMMPPAFTPASREALGWPVEIRRVSAPGWHEITLPPLVAPGLDALEFRAGDRVYRVSYRAQAREVLADSDLLDTGVVVHSRRAFSDDPWVLLPFAPWESPVPDQGRWVSPERTAAFEVSYHRDHARVRLSLSASGPVPDVWAPQVRMWAALPRPDFAVLQWELGGESGPVWVRYFDGVRWRDVPAGQASVTLEAPRGERQVRRIPMLFTDASGNTRREVVRFVPGAAFGALLPDDSVSLAAAVGASLRQR